MEGGGGVYSSRTITHGGAGDRMGGRDNGRWAGAGGGCRGVDIDNWLLTPSHP